MEGDEIPFCTHCGEFFDDAKSMAQHIYDIHYKPLLDEYEAASKKIREIETGQSE